jgi:hypothetical protein
MGHISAFETRSALPVGIPLFLSNVVSSTNFCNQNQLLTILQGWRKQLINGCYWV